MGYRTKVKPDYNIIDSFISNNSAVLDLGCGDGVLLSQLIEKKNVKGIGIDIFPEGLNECLKKGLPVLQLDLNKGLERFKDNTFDFVVLNMTLQAMYNPLLIIKEMVRVGKKAIVGFPNFGHWKLLFNLLVSQRMPKTETLPYEWYDTPNIRLMTIKDFRILCSDNGIRIIEERFLGASGKRISGRLISWRATEGIFLLERAK